MRVMVIGKATPETEAGTLPSPEAFADMERFNDELVKAGVLLGGEGLYPSATARRVRFDGERRTVTDGPFVEIKELIAGYSFWQVRSMDEAVEWAKRAPIAAGELEIRRVYEHADFGEAMGLGTDGATEPGSA